jgi:hypothetical protein
MQAPSLGVDKVLAHDLGPRLIFLHWVDHAQFLSLSCRCFMTGNVAKQNGIKARGLPDIMFDPGQPQKLVSQRQEGKYRGLSVTTREQEAILRCDGKF